VCSPPFSAALCKSPRDALTAPGLFIKENDALQTLQRSRTFSNSNKLYPMGFIRIQSNTGMESWKSLDCEKIKVPMKTHFTLNIQPLQINAQ